MVSVREGFSAHSINQDATVQVCISNIYPTVIYPTKFFLSSCEPKIKVITEEKKSEFHSLKGEKNKEKHTWVQSCL